LAGAEDRKDFRPDGPQRMAAEADGARAPLFAGNESEDFRTKWEKIQAGFVD